MKLINIIKNFPNREIAENVISGTNYTPSILNNFFHSNRTCGNICADINILAADGSITKEEAQKYEKILNKASRCAFGQTRKEVKDTLEFLRQYIDYQTRKANNEPIDKKSYTHLRF